MTILEPYIPKEYLALKINYCKQKLAELPEVAVKERKIKALLKMFTWLKTTYICLTVKQAQNSRA